MMFTRACGGDETKQGMRPCLQGDGELSKVMRNERLALSQGTASKTASTLPGETERESRSRGGRRWGRRGANGRSLRTAAVHRGAGNCEA